ncbi:hypothetical protein BOX15_Mlig007316g2 [Macrostomum lignano]|uniref:Uncharacterized protein n=2 Tax=Macrostomum lignano TaxID=282301 RepID=A0A267E5L7_9PLAT|nr:hypothetical protein BOX15_Mlig007316g1 [Macrostomum lignano]PAA85742.1 hypothetical protein BOX15_Mlig007316g2 [Macrostomum lignano]
MARVLLRGRSDVVGAMRPSFPQFLARKLADRDTEFPRRMGPRETRALLSDSSATGQRQFSLLRRTLTESGALHLTGIAGIDSPERFQSLLFRLGLATVEYRGGLGHRVAGSKSGSNRVYSASDEPPEFTIEMHNEKADTPDLPDVISFWCEVPAQAGNGGETVLLHSDSVLDRIDPAVLKRLEDKKICYWRRLKHKREAGDYLSWQAVFHTDDKVAVETYLKQRQFSLQWDSNNDSLTYWNVISPTKIHPITGRKVWCNSIQSHHSSYYSVHPSYRGASEHLFTSFYGDQSPIEDSVLQHIREASWSGAIGFQLGRHEMVIVDNHQVQHGRMAFQGPRKLKVAISKPWTFCGKSVIPSD